MRAIASVQPTDQAGSPLKPSRVAPAAILAVLVSLSFAACAPSPEEQREAAMESCVEAERATIPAVLGALPGMYSALEISGELEADLVGAAVIHFTYTYERMVEFGDSASGLSWDAARPSWAEPLVPWSVLGAAKADLLQGCDDYVFPAMREAGITGPLRVEYVYMQPSFNTVSWDATCETAR
jgi:hypothetical protein